MNYIREYYRRLFSDPDEPDHIVSCKRIRQQYKILIDLLDDQECQYVFDEDRGTLPIVFIESFCRQAQGDIGSPLKLELFQKAKLQAVFGFIDKKTGLRKFREVMDMRARKNGKTTELAALAMYMTLADGEGAPETYFIATKKDQADKGFNEAWNMIKQNEELQHLLRKRKSDIYCATNLGYMKSLASNRNSLDGLNGSCIVIDELSAMKDRAIYDLMIQSMSSRDQPLLTSISTNNFVRGAIFDDQYKYACDVLDGKIIDETFISFLYELDDRDEWDDPDCWIKANPGLGTIKKVKILSEFVEKAKNDPSFKATVMVKDFNMTENSASAWLRWEELNNETMFDISDIGFKYAIGAFDYAETTDLASAKICMMRPGDDHVYWNSMYWTPEAMFDKKDIVDKVPYKLWEKRGLIRVSEGNTIKPRDLLNWFLEFQEETGINLLWIGYDPWHVDQSILEEYRDNFGKNSMIPVRQGVYTLSAPMKELKAELEAHKHIYNNDPIDKWCLANLNIKTDINGNIQPIKGCDPTQRIDGGVSMIIGEVILRDKMQEYRSMIE